MNSCEAVRENQQTLVEAGGTGTYGSISQSASFPDPGQLLTNDKKIWAFPRTVIPFIPEG